MSNDFLIKLLEVIQGITETLLAPIMLILDNFLPDLSALIAYVGTWFNYYFFMYAQWFMALFPPYFKMLMGIWLTFVVAYYTGRITYLVISRLFKLIKNIKFW